MKYLAGLQLSEDSKWVQLLSVGKVKHPLHGEIPLTQEKLQKFVDNFKAGVRGTDLDIDYDHKQDPAKGRKAAGWIKDLVADTRGLWAQVDWTDEAKQAIKSGEYKYTSAEFLDKWTDQEGKVHYDVLAGAAITNRPFLKNMVPVNLNEVLLEDEEDSMNEELKKALIAKYQLSDDATEDQIKQAVHNEKPDESNKVDLSKATIEWSDDKSTAKVKIPGTDGEVEVKAPEPVKASEEDEHLKKLAETDPQVKALLDEREENNKRMQRIEQAQRLTEINAQLNEITGLPPVVLTELRDTLVTAPKQFSDKVVDAVKQLAEKGFVPQGTESGGGGPSANDDVSGGDAVKKFNDAVEKAKKDNKELSDTDAYELVATQNPLLYDQYSSAVRDGRTAFQETE